MLNLLVLIILAAKSFEVFLRRTLRTILNAPLQRKKRGNGEKLMQLRSNVKKSYNSTDKEDTFKQGQIFNKISYNSGESWNLKFIPISNTCKYWSTSFPTRDFQKSSFVQQTPDKLKIRPTYFPKSSLTSNWSEKRAEGLICDMAPQRKDTNIAGHQQCYCRELRTTHCWWSRDVSRALLPWSHSLLRDVLSWLPSSTSKGFIYPILKAKG